MCGFAGILNSSIKIQESTIHQIASLVSFRGPDHTGSCIYNEHLQRSAHGVHAIFFNRLSIIDLDPRSNQPFEDGQFTLVFNGEIYNYQELRQELANLGITFKTTSDTEVLFHALRIWGKNVLAKLNGMFAFAWIDRKNRMFLLARDRTGIKPLYYKQENDAFIFGSELDSILRLSKQEPKISTAAVQDYLWLQYVSTPFSIIENIFKLPPGHYLEGSFDLSKNISSLTSEPFWDAYELIRSGSSSEHEDLETLLIKSLESQLHADVPVGLFLSSGVDSSLLAALVNRHFAIDKCFTFITVNFNEKTETDESEDAEEFLKGFGNTNLHHCRVTIDADHIGNIIDSLYDYYDEPFGDQAALLNFVISKKARELVKVAISGDGADELFWGYPRYNEWQKHLTGGYHKLPGSRVLESLARHLPSHKWRHRVLLRFLSDPVQLHTLLLKPRGIPFMEGFSGKKDLWWRQNFDGLNDRDDLASVLDFKTYLPDAMLYKVDRSSMGASLEVRVPYLDNHVIDYALTLPLSLKSTSRYSTKSRLKTLLNRLAPHYRIDSPKKGFNFPLNRWLRHEWKDRVFSTVTRENLEDIGLDSSFYMNLVNRYYESDENLQIEVWRIFNLTLWYQKFRNITSLREV